MVTTTGLTALQYEQQQHDEIAHRDILCLSVDRRTSKYAGRLFSDETISPAAL
jgi:hypothetical protein